MFNKPRRAVDRVFLHCSASDNPKHDNVATMDRWHRERGWSGVGYHLFIRKDGTLEHGRSLEKTPAAQSGHNKGTIAICLHGLKKERFTSEQFKTLRQLCKEIDFAYGGDITFHGHKEVARKACPVFDYKAVLSLNRYGVMNGTDGFVAVSERPVSQHPTLKRGARGDFVVRLQEIINSQPDGIFGPGTEKALKAWQQEAGLEPDGIVGPLTWAALLAD